MRRKSAWWMGLAAAVLAAATARAEQVSVQVREAALRSSPSALAPVAGTAAYADPVTVVERRGGWVQVRTAAGVTGWLHQSAVTRQRLALRAGEETVDAGATTREVALAGKGFSEDVEREFRKTNTNANYVWVDRLERIEVTPERVAAFLREGGVAPQGDRP